MKKLNYLSIVTLIGLMALISGCQDSQILNPMTSADSNDMQLTALSTVGESTVGVAGVFIDPIANLQLSSAQLSAGYVIDVTGYVGYKSAASNPWNPRLTELHLEVNKDGEGWLPINSWDDGQLRSEENVRDNKPGRKFDDTAFGTDFNKWTINATGSYKVRATAEFTGPYADAVDTTEDIVVTLEMSFEVEFPAAPAIAARILEANDINARYGSSRTGGNYISDVAKLMGPGTNFNGVPKELWVNDEKVMNKAYWDAVKDYLSSRGLSVPNAPAGYIW